MCTRKIFSLADVNFSFSVNVLDLLKWNLSKYMQGMVHKVLRKAFYKRTRRGKVVRIVHEKYMRNDLQCGYFLSESNEQDNEETSEMVKEVAKDFGAGRLIGENDLLMLVNKLPQKHLIVIDTNICIHEMDFLEYCCPETRYLVICQTVLNEVRHRNLSIYRRLVALLKDSERLFIFYPNELSGTTASIRYVSFPRFTSTSGECLS